MLWRSSAFADAVDAGQAVARVIDMAQADRASYVVTPNVEIVMARGLMKT